MQEAHAPSAATAGFRNKITWLGMSLAATLGMIFCLDGVYLCQQELKNNSHADLYFHIPTGFKITADMVSSGEISGQSRGSQSGVIRGDVSRSIGTISGQIDTDGTSRFSGETEIKGRLTGFISDESQFSRRVSVSFPKPNRPWLCMAMIFWIFTSLAYLRRVYLIIRRKTKGVESTGLIAKTMAIGGLLYCSGQDRGDGAFLLGLIIMAYAGIGYLAYTRWERVRAQLYKD
jgi:hypothetical protein